MPTYEYRCPDGHDFERFFRKMSDAPADYLAEQLAHIVGLEMEITRIDGKRKLSQNRELRDFDSTVAALQARGQVELANAMLRVRGDGGA